MCYHSCAVSEQTGTTGRRFCPLAGGKTEITHQGRVTGKLLIDRTLHCTTIHSMANHWWPRKTLWHQTWSLATCYSCLNKCKCRALTSIIVGYSPEAAVHHFFQHLTSKLGQRPCVCDKRCRVHAVWEPACFSVFVCVHVSANSSKLALVATSCMQRRE